MSAEHQGRERTHWDGCWRAHHDCAVARLERFEALAERAKAFMTPECVDVLHTVLREEVDDLLDALRGLSPTTQPAPERA